MEELEQKKRDKEKLVAEFEADKKYNLEIKKMGPDYGKKPTLHQKGGVVNAAGEKVKYHQGCQLEHDHNVTCTPIKKQVSRPIYGKKNLR